jgi:cobalt-zinc-cadmium efflux system protein
VTGCSEEHPASARRGQHGTGAGGNRGHSHGISADADGRYLAVALGLIVGFLIFDVAMAFAGHSLALVVNVAATRAAAGR